MTEQEKKGYLDLGIGEFEFDPNDFDPKRSEVIEAMVADSIDPQIVEMCNNGGYQPSRVPVVLFLVAFGLLILKLITMVWL